MTMTFNRVSETLTVTVNTDGKLVKRYHTQYLCESATEMTRDEVADAVGIQPGAPHAEWPFATCNAINITRLPTREPYCKWHADYDHATDAVVPNDAADADPTLRRVNRSTGTQQQQKAIIRDKNGVMLVDTAGSPFDGGVPVTDRLGTITWKRDEDHTSTSTAQAFLLSGKLNDATFMGCAAGTLQLDVSGEEKWEGTYHFWTFTYVMTYNPEGHQPQPADAGLWELDRLGARRRIMENGEPAQTPQPLTTLGHVVPVANRPADCRFLTFEHYDEMDFTTLSLPTT